MLDRQHTSKQFLFEGPSPYSRPRGVLFDFELEAAPLLGVKAFQSINGLLIVPCDLKHVHRLTIICPRNTARNASCTCIVLRLGLARRIDGHIGSVKHTLHCTCSERFPIPTA